MRGALHGYLYIVFVKGIGVAHHCVTVEYKYLIGVVMGKFLNLFINNYFM